MSGRLVKFMATLSAVAASQTLGGGFSKTRDRLPARCSLCGDLVPLPVSDPRRIRAAMDRHLATEHGLQSLGVIYGPLDDGAVWWRTFLWVDGRLLDGRLPIVSQDIPNDNADIILECCPRGRYAEPVSQPIDTVDRLVARERIRVGALGAPRSLFPLPAPGLVNQGVADD